MAELVQKRHLNTGVQDNCVCACTLIFLAGAERELTEDAELGFHQFSSDGTRDIEQQATIQQMRESYRAFGVREWFIDHVAATPPTSMWYPTRDELKSAGVLK